jgi:rhodanese-related sulfurtransferase
MAAVVPSEVDVSTAARLVKEGAVIVDVREPAELAICAVAGSLHIPMRQIPARIGELPADRVLLVLCHVGARSRSVTQYLRAQGRSDVANIAGGIEAWADRIDPTLARY